MCTTVLCVGENEKMVYGLSYYFLYVYSAISSNKQPWWPPAANRIPCCGLLPHLRDIRNDWKLLNGDILHLLETSLPVEIDTQGIKIYGYIYDVHDGLIKEVAGARKD